MKRFCKDSYKEKQKEYRSV